MELATVHKYSIFIEFPQDGAYRLVEMQHCRNSVEFVARNVELYCERACRKKKIKPEARGKLGEHSRS